MKIVELKQFIDELNELLKNSPQEFPKTRLSTNIIETELDLDPTISNDRAKDLTETEIKVYIKINHYFRLLTITVTNLTVAYEVWLKGILKELLNEVGLSFETWDSICAMGDQSQQLQKKVDEEWTNFLTLIKQGKLNRKVWEFIQTGKERSDKLMKQKIYQNKN